MYFGEQKTRILILNDGEDCGAPYAPLFKDLGEINHDPANLKLDPLKYKLVVFTGGADVSPELYGDTSPKGVCHVNKKRDEQERNIYHFARQRGIRMVGICRGMQFLNVMTGGKMIHDLAGHSGGSHMTMTRDRDEPFLTNSFHHQMCILHKDSHLLAWSHVKLSKAYIGDKDEPVDYKGPEVEAFYHPWDHAMGVQWHPEATADSGDWLKATSWFKHLVKDMLDQTPRKFRQLYCGSSYDKLTITEVN